MIIWKLIPALLGFITTILLILLLNPLSTRLGWVDKPDQLRKLHGTAIPLTGGVAMVVAMLITMLFLHFTLNNNVNFHIITGICIMCLIGLWDDKFHLSARLRLLLQSIVALLLILTANFSMSNLGNIFGANAIVLSKPISILFTVFCVVGAINAINMIDGVDGLAGGVALTALLWMLTIANPIDAPETNMLITLIGCVVGYLCFNMRTPLRKRAAIFMGDAGSTSLGVALVWLLISFSQSNTYHSQSIFPPVIALWLVAVPLLDTISLIVSRGLKGKSPFKADRDHFHHILVDSGLSDGETTIIIILVSAGIGGAGILAWYLGVPESVLLFSFLILTLSYYYFIHHSKGLKNLVAKIKNS